MRVAALMLGATRLSGDVLPDDTMFVRAHRADANGNVMSSRSVPRDRRSPARLSRVLLGFLCLAVVACGGERSRIGVTGPPGSPSGPIERDAGLVGSWWRILLFTDDDGTAHASETTWRFEADGDATRTVVASNLTHGFFDTVVAGARWRTEGGAVVIDFAAPNSGTVRFAYRVSADTLMLDTRAFLRRP